MRHVIVAGASRGLGAEVARHCRAAGDRVVSLSRNPSPHGDWLCCDLADPAQIAALGSTIADPVDALIVVAGIWEDQAFSPDYSLAGSSADEITRILAINLQAPILLAKALEPRLRGGRILLIGSTSGLDHVGTPEVAYNASKAGLRGAAQALAQALKGQGIAVAILNPGDIGTEDVLAAKRDGTMRDEASLPMSDLLAAIDLAMRLSPASSFCEIDLIPLRS